MTATRSGAFAGLRVVDLTTFLSGPFCTQMLADLGAEVVKVEHPGGDSSRAIPPHFVGADSAYFLSTNRNKRSIAVDMKSPRGIDVVRRLIASADVVVENFRPGVCARLGIDPAEIRAAQPDLVWASITGFGHEGPWRDRGAYDMIVQAASGVMSLTGEPEGPPVRLGIPAGDLVAGLYAGVGIGAALHERARTGLGQMVDVAMFDSQLAMLSYQSAYALIAGVTPPPQGSAHDSIPTYRTFTAGDDRMIAITANTDGMWRGACEVLGLPDLPADPRFLDPGARLENRHALWRLWETAFATRPAAEWAELMTARGVPAATIRSVPEALEESEAAGRQMVLDLDGADESIRVVGNPMRMSGSTGGTHQYPPSLGADTDQILLEELGLSSGEISALRADKVVL
ncbi:CaiB/BaiF CoA transferase family protein [Tomitella biformata]|uniref:CaiB/BaiF CoA transferase family protein n=1 Tax=Tomitella biformata TaxID=630403 RepID=UPI00046441BF|nr:CoA transferase [Tomitella biformata]